MADEEQPMEVELQESLATNVSRGFSREDYGPVEVPPAPQTVATYDVNGPRLIITHIENENFKSYAGMQSLGPFHKSFTSIVGPNGSGKSNVIDSMLFVFGYRANKIRSKKISVLIHNSENHKNVESCTVAVHFQKIVDTGPGEDEYTVVPDSHIAVSRTAFRDNSSHYCINGKRSQYKEVASLLRASGIDLDHNRFLILQGEVEQIAMMKPKAQTEHEDGMLEFLEDIVGSNRFKEPIQTLAKRVEELNELRVEKLNRVKAVEAEKDNLEGAKEEAVKFIQLENQIAREKNRMCQKYIYNSQQALGNSSKELEKVLEASKELNKKLADLAAEKAARTKNHKATYKKHEAAKAEFQEASDNFKECEVKDVKWREDIKHLSAKSKKSAKTLEQEKKKIEELRAVPGQSEKAVAMAKKKLEELEAKKKEEEEHLQKVMDSLKTETQGMQQEKDEKEEKLIGLKEAVNETKSKLDLGQSELDLYLSTQQSETQKLQEMQKHLANAESTVKERQREMSEIKKNLPGMEKTLARAKEDLKAAEAADTKLTEEVRSLRSKVEEARSSMQASKSRNHVLTALMEEKKQGRLPGIYGRLGDLGGIDEKYDVAISTACGALDNIVVDSINTAQRCVEFLKKNNIGSATFVGLDKMQRWKEHAKRKINTPENVPRLFDLVKVEDESVLPAFYFALRDTLVAKDLDQATRIAYGKTRFRVVTLQGHLIDQSGTMSGGGKTVCRGRMGASAKADVDPKELSNMENRLQKASTESQQCRQNREKLEDIISQNEKSVTQMKHNLEKFDIDVKALTEQMSSLKSQIKEQEVQVKAAAPDEKELGKLKTKVEAFKKDYQKAAEAASKIETEVQKLHKKIMEVGGAKLKAAQTRVDAVAGQIDTVQGQITKANVEVKTAERNLKKAEAKVASLEEEMQEAEEKKQSLQQQLKDIEVDAAKWHNLKTEKEKEVLALEAELQGVKGEVEELEKGETALQKDNIELKNQEGKLTDNVREHHAKIKHWKKERECLQISPVEGDEDMELPVLEEEELEGMDLKNSSYQITVLEEVLNKMKPNMAAIAEYRKKEEMYLQRVAELDEITEVRDGQRHLHEDLRKQRLSEFMAGFTVITNKLKEMYQMITLGGDAELELVDSLDPFSEGIVFSVRPPKKSWKNISNLSGGEKTLSSLALVFALHHYKPTPLYVMDEIDAALDFKNVSIVANYIKERTRNAQFIIISLRNNMFELADRLVGIFKTDNCTKSVTINPSKMSLPLQELSNTADNRVA